MLYCVIQSDEGMKKKSQKKLPKVRAVEVFNREGVSARAGSRPASAKRV